MNESRLKNVIPGSGTANDRTLSRAIEVGKIRRGDARLSSAANALVQAREIKVDFSVLRAGGQFDNGYQIPLLPRSN